MKHENPRRRSVAAIVLLLSMALLIFSNAATSQSDPRARVTSGVHPATLSIGRVDSENDLSTLSIYAEFEPWDWYFHQVFLDTDNNAATGFSVPSIQHGAEFLVEGEFLYRYTGTGRNWSWQPIRIVGFELGARSVRWRIDRAAIGDSGAPNLTRFRVHLQKLIGDQAGSGVYQHLYPVETSPTAQQLGIPAYIWSGDAVNWQRLLATDPLALDLLIVGVANGPWTQPVPQLVAHVDTARNQGRRVLGYVYTKMGQRDLREVLDDIDRYYRWYRINGIFVDEADYDCDQVDYYRAIYWHIKRKAADQRVVLNPGRVFEECMMPNADIFMSFETGAEAYLSTPTSWVLPPFADRYPRSRFWHVVHSTPTSQLAAVVERSKQLHVGRLWVTSDVLDNPYDTFPDAAYYNTLLRLASESPTAATNQQRSNKAPTVRSATRQSLREK